MLDRAIEIAAKAHTGQKTKDGDYYILHPLWVMSQVFTSDEKIVAVLHDVVEDTDVTLDDLKKEFPKHITDALDALTHIKHEPYMDYIQRVAFNVLARKVKIKDLEHNMMVGRLTGKVSERFRNKIFDKYIPAYQYLKGLEK